MDLVIYCICGSCALCQEYNEMGIEGISRNWTELNSRQTNTHKSRRIYLHPQIWTNLCKMEWMNKLVSVN